eukprot:104735-Amphidinium_carterae.1
MGAVGRALDIICSAASSPLQWQIDQDCSGNCERAERNRNCAGNPHIYTHAHAQHGSPRTNNEGGKQRENPNPLKMQVHVFT